jgi:folate-binding protein YgfZ
MSETATRATPEAAAEYAAVREHAGLVDRGEHGVLEVTGRDRATFLHAMLTNDIKALAPGTGCAAALLDVHGKVQALLLVWALDDRLLVVTPAGLAEKVVQDLDRYLFAEKAVFRNAIGEYALLMLAGPEAPALAERVAGTVPPERAWSHVQGRVAGADVRLVRGGGETGEPEVWIVAAAGAAGPVRDALVAAGARPVGAAARESLRIEAGTPVQGREADDTVLLPELPSQALVSHTKGCYLGQEVVVRIRDRGHVNRHLRGLLIESDTVPAPGSPVLADGADVGRVTSGTWSYGLRRPIALAFVRRRWAEPGTAVTVRAGKLDLAATVSPLPFTR